MKEKGRGIIMRFENRKPQMNAPTRKPVKEEVGRAGDKQGLSTQSPLVV